MFYFILDKIRRILIRTLICVFKLFVTKIPLYSRLVFLTILIIAFFIKPVHSQNSDYSPWWIYYHGDYAQTEGKNDPRVKWAFRVFERLKEVSDKPEGAIPMLYIVKATQGNYAMALPDGGIIINPETLRICYDGVPRDYGDSRLAFILGHELAHLANKDYGLYEVYRLIETYGDEKAQRDFKRHFKFSTENLGLSGSSGDKEFLADKNGCLYASMAGYDIAILNRGKDNFFYYWAKQAHLDISSSKNRHPSIKKRVEFLNTQLSAIGRHIELFRAGVLLYQIGSYNDAAEAFKQFSLVYPSSEVFNNLGACYLNLALDLIRMRYNAYYYVFRFSIPIDYSSSASDLSNRGDNQYLNDKEIVRYIDKSLEYFKIAASRDPIRGQCRYNLSIALILKAEYAASMAVSDEILKIRPKDALALNNKAIAFYYYGQKEGLDVSQKIIATLEDALRIDSSKVEILYNLGSIKEARKRNSGARFYWEKYLTHPLTPRDNFYTYIYRKLYRRLPTVVANQNRIPESPSWVHPGDNFWQVVKNAGKNKQEMFTLGAPQDGSNGNNWSMKLRVMVKDSVRVLALDDTVELVERELNPLEEIAQIGKIYGIPPRVIRSSDGNFYLYKDRGFSVREKNGKVCSIIWFERGF